MLCSSPSPWLTHVRNIFVRVQGLTSVLLGLFALILTSGALQVDWPAAIAHAHADWGAAGKASRRRSRLFLCMLLHSASSRRASLALALLSQTNYGELV